MKALYVLPILAAIAGPMWAVDGVVLINQNNALAGNVTPGDTPGFPVTIAVSGSYKLSGNLTVPDDNTGAILITADNVTIDLNGFTIRGPNSCTGFPTRCTLTGTGIGIFTGNNDIAVSNGDIRGMGGDGLNLTGENNRIDKVRATNNGGNGINTQYAIVSQCLGAENGQDGIHNFAGLVDGSLAIGNAANGIYVSFGRVSTTLTFSNFGMGLFADCPANIVNNQANHNTTGSIVTAGSGCGLANNTVQ